MFFQIQRATGSSFCFSGNDLKAAGERALVAAKFTRMTHFVYDAKGEKMLGKTVLDRAATADAGRPVWMFKEN